MDDNGLKKFLRILGDEFGEIIGLLFALAAVCFLFFVTWLLFYGLPCAIAMFLGAS